MYAVYYPTVEQLRGLAILSRWPLAEAGGLLLPGDGEQLGAQRARLALGGETVVLVNTRLVQIGRASCRERVEHWGVAGPGKMKVETRRRRDDAFRVDETD